MATMANTYQDLYNRVSKFLGTYGGSGPTGTDLTDAKDIVKRGYMKFLTVYDWTFRRQYTTLTTESGKDNYELPEDFGGIRTKFQFENRTGYPPLEERSEGEILEMRGYGDFNSYPEYYAIRAGKYNPQGGQRYEVLFWPTPTSEYNLYYSYYYMPPMMSNDSDVPMGGADVAECIMQYCLMAAGEEADEEIGVQSQAAANELQSAIRIDQRKEPRELGYMRNAGKELSPWEVARGTTRTNNVTYNTD